MLGCGLRHGGRRLGRDLGPQVARRDLAGLRHRRRRGDLLREGGGPQAGTGGGGNKRQTLHQENSMSARRRGKSACQRRLTADRRPGPGKTRATPATPAATITTGRASPRGDQGDAGSDSGTRTDAPLSGANSGTLDRASHFPVARGDGSCANAEQVDSPGLRCAANAATMRSSAHAAAGMLAISFPTLTTPDRAIPHPLPATTRRDDRTQGGVPAPARAHARQQPARHERARMSPHGRPKGELSAARRAEVAW